MSRGLVAGWRRDRQKLRRKSVHGSWVARRRAVWRQTQPGCQEGAPPGTKMSDNPEAFKGWGAQAGVPCLGVAPLAEALSRPAGATPRTKFGVQQPGRRSRETRRRARPKLSCGGPAGRGDGMPHCRPGGMWPGGRRSRLWTDAQSRELNLYLIVRPESSRFGQARLLSDDRSTEAKPGTDCAPARQYR